MEKGKQLQLMPIQAYHEDIFRGQFMTLEAAAESIASRNVLYIQWKLYTVHGEGYEEIPYDTGLNAFERARIVQLKDYYYSLRPEAKQEFLSWINDES